MKLKKHEAKMYECDNCKHRWKHIDMYNEEFCYECIDIETGKLKEKNKIRHFIVDLEEIKDEYSYNSDEYTLARELIEKLEKLIIMLRDNE